MADRPDAFTNLEAELLEERVDALRRAGDRLQDAIDAWRRLAARNDVPDERRAAGLAEVTDAAYALMVQRDCAGFRYGNLRWMAQEYDIPREVLRRL